MVADKAFVLALSFALGEALQGVATCPRKSAKSELHVRKHARTAAIALKSWTPKHKPQCARTGLMLTAAANSQHTRKPTNSNNAVDVEALQRSRSFKFECRFTAQAQNRDAATLAIANCLVDPKVCQSQDPMPDSSVDF